MNITLITNEKNQMCGHEKAPDNLKVHTLLVRYRQKRIWVLRCSIKNDDCHFSHSTFLSG